MISHISKGVECQCLIKYLIRPSSVETFFVPLPYETLADWTRDVHDGARKMIVAKADQEVSDGNDPVTRAQSTSNEIALRWSQD